MGTQLSPKGAQSPFGTWLLWPNSWMDQDATGTEVGLGAGHIVLDGDPAPSPLKGSQHATPLFSVHVCCGQMGGWIKVPFGTEVGLGPGNIGGTQLIPLCS